jgi:hypothetical protein
MKILKNILISIALSFIIIQFQMFLQSDYIVSFLKQNLITLILALMAINTTTLSIVLTKIRELIDKTNYDTFNSTKKEMILSIKEQIVLVVTSIIIFIVSDSNWLKLNLQYKQLIDTFCVTIFVYDLWILFDTSKSIFILLDFNKKLKEKE